MKSVLPILICGTAIMLTTNCSIYATDSPKAEKSAVAVNAPTSVVGKTFIVSYQNATLLKSVEGSADGGWKSIMSVDMNGDDGNVLCGAMSPKNLSISLNFKKGNKATAKVDNRVKNTFVYKKISGNKAQIQYQSDLDHSGIINLEFISPTEAIATETNRGGDYEGKIKNIKITIQ